MRRGCGSQGTDGRRRIRPDCRRPLRLDIPGRAALCVATAERRRLLLGGQPSQRLLLSVDRRARTALVGRPGGLGPDLAFSTRPLARLVHSPDAVGGRLRRHLSPVAALRRAKRKWQTQRFAPWLFDTRRNTLMMAVGALSAL